MKLLFELRPVEHLEASVDYYRTLGLIPLTWPSDDSALLGTAHDAHPVLALVQDPAEGALGTGGVYDAGDLDAFFEQHTELDWLLTPGDGPFGRYAVFADRTGTAIRLLDPTDWHQLRSGNRRLTSAAL